MTTWEQANRRAGVMAGEWHAELGIDLSRPVDPFDTIRRLGIILAFGRLGRTSGLYLPAGPAQPQPGILLHAGHPRTRQRYSAAHELGHHVFGHAMGVDGDLERARRKETGWTAEEKEAEAFGAWFLMPRRLIRTGLRTLGIDTPRDPLDVYALSLWLGTSYTATAHQLATVRIVGRDDASRWATVPPRTIKRTIAGTMVPDIMRNDVLWVDVRRAAHEVSGRPGDRIVVTVDDVPSSGITWRVAERSVLPLAADSFMDDWDADIHLVHDDGELAGGTYPRSFALDVPPGIGVGPHPLELIRDRPFDESEPVERVRIPVTIDPGLSGLQLPEAAMAMHS